MSRIARLRTTGIFLGISTATWLTLLGQWVVAHEQLVPFGLAFPIGMLWLIVMIMPANLLAHVLGWQWGEASSLSAAQLSLALIVNAVLWGLAGMIPASILKSRRASKLGHRMLLFVGVGLLVAGCIVNDGLWLRNIGLFLLVMGGVIPAIYSKWFKNSRAGERRTPSPDFDLSGGATRWAIALTACSWIMITIGIALTAWFYPSLWAFLPYVLFAFANVAARQTSTRRGVLVLVSFSVFLAAGWFWHAESVNYFSLPLKLITVIVGEILLAGVTLFVVRHVERLLNDNTGPHEHSSGKR